MSDTEQKPYRVKLEFREDLSDADISVSKALAEVVEKFPDQVIIFTVPIVSGDIEIKIGFIEKD